MGKRADAAVENFYKGCNCSQSVFCAFADLYGFDRETAMRISASFGGGMGRMREVCGAFSGILLVNGMETGAVRGEDKEAKAANYKKVQELAEVFKERNGGTYICRELLGLTKQAQAEETFKPAERTDQYYKKRPCPEIVRRAAEILEETFGLE